MGTAGGRNIQISVNRRLSLLKWFPWIFFNTKGKIITQNLYQKIKIKQVLSPNGLLDTKPRAQRGHSLCFKDLIKAFHNTDWKMLLLSLSPPTICLRAIQDLSRSGPNPPLLFFLHHCFLTYCNRLFAFLEHAQDTSVPEPLLTVHTRISQA